MNDLEERLRAELSELTSADLDLGVTADEVLASGHSARRRRSIRGAVAGIAAALAIGVLYYTAVSGRTLVGVPEPMQTPPSAAVGDGRAHFDLQGVGSTSGESLYQALDVTVEREAASLEVTFTTTATTGERVETRSHGDGERLLLEKVGSRLWAGVFPHRVQWYLLLDRSGEDGAGAWSWDEYDLEKPEVTVIYRMAHEPGPWPGLQGYLWQSMDGVYRNSADQVVPSAEIRFESGESVTYFRDDRLDVEGYRDGSGTTSQPVTSDPDSELVKFEETELPENSASPAEVTSIGVLPAGASDLKVVLNGTGGEWSAAKLSGRDQIAFAARSTGVPVDDYLIRSVSYTDAAGKRVTYRPRY